MNMILKGKLTNKIVEIKDVVEHAFSWSGIIVRDEEYNQIGQEVRLTKQAYEVMDNES